MADFSEHLAATAYEGIFFPALDVDATGGHDSARHLSPGVPGADVETTGRKPLAIRMRIALLNDLPGRGRWDDDLFPRVYRELLEAFESTPIGTLSHPTRGPVTVHVDEWRETIDANARNGVFLDVGFTEHNAESSLETLGAGGAAAVREAPADAMLLRAAEADAAGGPLGVPPVLATVTAALAALETAGQVRRDVDAAVATVLAAVSGRLAYADVGGLAGHDYRLALERLAAAAYDAREALLRLSRPRRYTVAQAMSLARIAALPQVYGDPARAALLRAANEVPDPSRVPAGTVLDVPDPGV